MRIIQILWLLPLLILTFSGAKAQQNKTLKISGVVQNETGEPLANVSVYIKDKPGGGSSTQCDGKFSIQLEYGDKIAFSSVCYDPCEHLAIKSEENLFTVLTE